MVAENPPKLWAYLAPAAERDGAHGATGLRVFANGEERCAIEGRAIAGSYHLDGCVSPVQVYLREDIASADVASLAATWGALQAKHEAEVTALRRERDDAVREHRPFEEVRTFLLSRMVGLLEARGVDVDFVYDELSALDDDDLAMEMQEQQDEREAEEERQAHERVGLTFDGGFADEPEDEPEDEAVAALRRERDALRLERDAVAREGWRACVLGVSIIRFWQAEAKSRSGDQRGALVLMNEAVALRDIFTAEDKAAGTGVG